MSKLIQKIKWNLSGLQTEMYVYGEADFKANKAMQEPLEKLYQYENQKNVENVTKIEDGITVCCGYDFGLDSFGKSKINYCPICGKKIVNKGSFK